MQEWVERHSFSLFFGAWLLFFFPSWYALSFTKVRELQRMIFHPREVQLQVLHPAGEMKQLLELRQTIQDQFPQRSVAIVSQVQDPRVPLATDMSIQRAVFFPVPVISLQEVANQEVLFVIHPEADKDFCQENPILPESFTGEVICWPIVQP